MTMAIVVNAYRAPVTRPEIRTLSMVYRFRIVAGVRAVPARTPAGLAVRGGRCRSGRRQVWHGLDLLADAFGGQRVDRRGRRGGVRLVVVLDLHQTDLLAGELRLHGLDEVLAGEFLTPVCRLLHRRGDHRTDVPALLGEAGVDDLRVELLHHLLVALRLVGVPGDRVHPRVRVRVRQHLGWDRGRVRLVLQRPEPDPLRVVVLPDRRLLHAGELGW